MKKEKTVRAYTRKTKSGKVVKVKQHTAKYDAAEEKAKEMSKKEGAGKEFEERKKKPVQLELPFDKEEEKKVLEEVKEDEKKFSKKEAKKEPKKETKKEKKVRPVGSGTNGPEPRKKSSDDKVMDRAKSMYSHNNPSGSKDRITTYLQKKGYSFKEAQSKANSIERAAKKERKSLAEQGYFPTTQKSKTTSASASSPTFTAAEFKEWYNGTGSAADKKVAKALRAQLGRSGYKKLEDEAIDNYSSRGHLSMFKRVSGGSEPAAKSGKSKTAATTSDSTKSKGDKQTKAWFKSSPSSFSEVKVSQDKKGYWRIDLSDGSGQIYTSKEGAQRDAKLLRGMYKEFTSKANEKTSVKESPASLRERADKMEAADKKATIEKKVGKGFKTIKNAQLNSPGVNTRTATLRGDLYIGKDGSAYYADPTNKGKLKKATEKILSLNKVSTKSAKSESTKGTEHYGKSTPFSGQTQLKQEMAMWKKSPTSATGKASRNNITKLLQEKKKQGYKLTKREEAFLGS